MHWKLVLNLGRATLGLVRPCPPNVCRCVADVQSSCKPHRVDGRRLASDVAINDGQINLIHGDRPTVPGDGSRHFFAASYIYHWSRGCGHWFTGGPGNWRLSTTDNDKDFAKQRLGGESGAFILHLLAAFAAKGAFWASSAEPAYDLQVPGIPIVELALGDGFEYGRNLEDR